jgi:hypothetical protein
MPCRVTVGSGRGDGGFRAVHSGHFLVELRVALGAGLAIQVGHASHGRQILVEMRVHREALLGRVVFDQQEQYARVQGWFSEGTGISTAAER